MIYLDIAIFALADSDWQLALDPYIEFANYQLASFDMRLNVYPWRPNPPIGIALVGEVYDPPPTFPVHMRPGDVRTAAGVVLPTSHGMPVIFCRIHQLVDGMTIYQEDTVANRGVPWLNYVLLQQHALSRDRSALLHEIIHAANYQGNIDHWGTRLLHDSQRDSIMRMGDTYPDDPPVFTYDRHAAALRTAYFARYA